MTTEYPVTDWKPIQQRLQDLGFYAGRIDGGRGPLTDQAIVAFKRSIFFVARPFYGPQTHQALMSPPVAAEESPYPWYREAELVLGLHERSDHSRLKEWFDQTVAWIDPREIAWCGAFVATCLRKWRPEVELPGNPLGARQWGAFGEACTPQRGAVLTFWRGSKAGWQGHVGFYAGEDPTAFHVLGGNQSDRVTITRIARNRLLQSRWPTGVAQPLHIRRLTAGGNLSTNEA